MLAAKCEAGPTYFESSVTRERIRVPCPDIKIVITVRNPVEQTHSSVVCECARGRVSASVFFEFVTAFLGNVNSGRYSILALQWESTFDQQHVLYMFQEDIESDPHGQLDALCTFLGLECIVLLEELRGRHGQGTAARFRWLAATSACIARTMRSAGLQQVVEFGKRFLFKKAYSGGNQNALEIKRPILNYLLSENEADLGFLEHRLGWKFSRWRNPDIFGLERG